jgi:hypothetical protein
MMKGSPGRGDIRPALKEPFDGAHLHQSWPDAAPTGLDGSVTLIFIPRLSPWAT